jgi:hypothetical protein
MQHFRNVSAPEISVITIFINRKPARLFFH